MVDVIRVDLGGTPFGLELKHVQSILTTREVADLPKLDPSATLGLTSRVNPHVALMKRSDGELVAVIIGKYLGIERWSAQDVMVLPTWLASTRAPLLHDACVWRQDTGIIWMLDTQALLQLPTSP